MPLALLCQSPGSPPVPPPLCRPSLSICISMPRCIGCHERGCLPPVNNTFTIEGWHLGRASYQPKDDVSESGSTGPWCKRQSDISACRQKKHPGAAQATPQYSARDIFYAAHGPRSQEAAPRQARGISRVGIFVVHPNVANAATGCLVDATEGLGSSGLGRAARRRRLDRAIGRFGCGRGRAVARSVLISLLVVLSLVVRLRVLVGGARGCVGGGG